MAGVVRFGVCFFEQKTAYEMRISDWSSDVCSSDLPPATAKLRPTTSAVNTLIGGLGGEAIAGWLGFVGACGVGGGGRVRCKQRSEESRVGKECVVRVALGGRRIINTTNIA